MPDVAVGAPVLEPVLVVVEVPLALHPLLFHAVGPVGDHAEDRDDRGGLSGARVSGSGREDLEGDGVAANRPKSRGQFGDELRREPGMHGVRFEVDGLCHWEEMELGFWIWGVGRGKDMLGSSRESVKGVKG